MNERTTISLPFPPSVNAMYRNVPGRGRVKDDPYKRWIENAGWELLSQRPRKFKQRVSVRISMNPPRRSCGDVDNRIKAVLDLLTRHGVIADDKRECVASVAAQWVDEGPICQVIVEVVT